MQCNNCSADQVQGGGTYCACQFSSTKHRWLVWTNHHGDYVYLLWSKIPCAHVQYVYPLCRCDTTCRALVCSSPTSYWTVMSVYWILKVYPTRRHCWCHVHGTSHHLVVVLSVFHCGMYYVQAYYECLVLRGQGYWNLEWNWKGRHEYCYQLSWKTWRSK